MTSRPNTKNKIASSSNSPLKNTEALSISEPSMEPASTVVAPTENGEAQHGKLQQVAPEVLSEREEENKEMTGVMLPSLEKKVSLVLVWVSPGIGTFLGAIPSIWLLRAIGERKFFAINLLLSSVATFWLAFMSGGEWNQLAIAGLRFVQGIAFASAFPVIGSLSANWGTLKEQFFFLAWSIFFVELAPMLSWPLCALCLRYDYKLPYLLQGAVTLITALIWVIFYRDRPQYHPWVNGLELNKIVTGKVRAINNRALEDQPFHLLLKSGPVWAIWVAAFGIMTAFTILVICGTVSVYGFGRSAVLVGRYFTQHIIANTQLFMGLAMLLTSTTVLLTVRSNSPYEWRPAFLVSAALLLICAAIFGVFGDHKAEEWAKESWDPSAARRMISADQIDYHHDECGIVEMRLLSH
ncbi:Putative small intestine sodium-dependent phosphate transport protein [Toxocara canis]|uniref:Putative small intestine sodium-dependent phosphate transport protein n=1 Tax=Toxocara canis TaxID=6265 RepID=A0A0B2W032_TOXCA|nr:Putative small intestine sodium-dependent phosphate transport protein [Toxocara canis]